MASYRYVAIPDDKPFDLDRNQNITEQSEVIMITQGSFSDDEDREERSSELRVRSQSLKYLNERVETESISRSKSLRDVVRGDFASVRARASYADSWNPVNPVGRGRIAERVKSWEDNLDADEGARRRKSSNNGMDRRNFVSGSYYNGTRSQDYDSYPANDERDWRDQRYEGYEAYGQETAQHAYDNYREQDRDQVGQLDCIP